MAERVNTRWWMTPRCTRSWVSAYKGMGINMAYSGGSNIATGRTHTAMKSRTSAPCV